MFGRATIRLGIGPHSSCNSFITSGVIYGRIIMAAYVIGQAIIFLPCGFFFFFSFFFPRLISAVADWMSTIGNVSPICPHNIENFGPLAAEICWRVWGTLAHFNGFRVLAALLHGTLVVGVSQTLQR